MTDEITNNNSKTSRTIYGNPWFYSTIIFAGILLFFAGAATQNHLQIWPRLLYPETKHQIEQKKANAASNTSLKKPDLRWVERVSTLSEQKSMGDTTAPVSITEFTDFQCPYCRQFVLNVFPKIIKNYVRKGKVHFKVRHFPLTKIHPKAPILANASECAASQNRFWQFRRYAMNNSNTINKNNQAIFAIARAIDISNMKKFRTCVENQKKMQIVEDDWEEARTQSVKATPSFLVNGQMVEGGRSYNKFRSIIERELNQ